MSEVIISELSLMLRGNGEEVRQAANELRQLVGSSDRPPKIIDIAIGDCLEMRSCQVDRCENKIIGYDESLLPIKVECRLNLIEPL